MKAPEELKAQAIDEAGCCSACEYSRTTYDHPYGCIESQAKVMIVHELVQYTEQLESTISQVSKALCGKKNATQDELLKAVNQLKTRLAQVERERDAAVESLFGECEECVWNQTMTGNCIGCVHNETAFMPGIDNWQWRGVCEENMKDGADE